MAWAPSRAVQRKFLVNMVSRLFFVERNPAVEGEELGCRRSDLLKSPRKMRKTGPGRAMSKAWASFQARNKCIRGGYAPCIVEENRRRNGGSYVENPYLGELGGRVL